MVNMTILKMIFLEREKKKISEHDFDLNMYVHISKSDYGNKILRTCHYSISKDTKVSFEHLHSSYFVPLDLKLQNRYCHTNHQNIF